MQETTPPQHQPSSMLIELRRPAVWVTAVVYVAFTVGLYLLVFSPFFRKFVEQNQSGLFGSYSSRFAGYDVVGAIVRTFYWDIFPIQQLLAVLLALALWRKQKAVALGILVVIFAFLVTGLCLALLIFALVRRGY